MGCFEQPIKYILKNLYKSLDNLVDRCYNKHIKKGKAILNTRKATTMKQVKVEWCENFIRAQFTKHHAFPGPNAGIEINCFWKMAEKSGLWERGTYGSPMIEALVNLTVVDSVHDDEGNVLFNVFRLAQ